MPHPCFRAPLPSIKAAFIALDGPTAFLTYFSAEIMLLSGLFAWHKMHTERKKKKNNARKKNYFSISIFTFWPHASKISVLDTLGGVCLLLQVCAAPSAHGDILPCGWQGHRTNKSLPSRRKRWHSLIIVRDTTPSNEGQLAGFQEGNPKVR